MVQGEDYSFLEKGPIEGLIMWRSACRKQCYIELQ